jgi:glycosyltransferase involved in cell wall biosynthesis
MNAPPRVIFVLNRIGAGGAETQVQLLAVGLAQRGHNVTIISLFEDTISSAALNGPGIERINLLGKRGWRSALLVRRLRAELSLRLPAVCICLMIPADVIGRVAAFCSGVPTISSLRNTYVGGSLVELALLATSSLPAAITTNSDAIKRVLGPRVSLRPKQIKIIHNAIDVRPFLMDTHVRYETRNELGINEGDFVWLAVGAQTPQKNYVGLLNSFSHFSDSYLAIAGADYQREILDATARKLGLARRVKLLGRRRDVPRLLAAADGFVQASSFEGMPNAVMEAMAAGKAVVATEVGGVPDLILTNINGILVPPSDEDALARGLQRVQDMSPEERALFGQRARQSVMEHHSLTAILDEWESCIDGVWKTSNNGSGSKRK